MTITDIQCRLEAYLALRQSLGFVTCYSAMPWESYCSTYNQKICRDRSAPKPYWIGLPPPAFIVDLPDKQHA